MYESFSIENFRGITNRVHLQPMAPVNILVGDNGAGKTSALEALWLHAQPSLNNLLASAAAFRALNADPMGWRWLLPASRPRSALRLWGKTGTDEWIVSLREGLPTGQAVALPETGPITDAGNNVTSGVPSTAVTAVTAPFERTGYDTLTAIARFSANGRVVQDFPAFEPVATALLDLPPGRYTQSVASAYTEARYRGRETTVLEGAQVLDPRIHRLSVVVTPYGTELAADLPDVPPIPLKLLGSGAQSVLWALCESVQAPPGTRVLIDGFDNALHYSKLTAIWRALRRLWREAGLQAVVTTHSRECLESAVDAFGADELAVHAFQRTAHGVAVGTFTKDMAQAAREFDRELR